MASRWSSAYDSFAGQGYFDRVHEAMLDSLAADATKPASVLDVGCGTGRLLRRARLRWPQAELIGIDPDEGMIEIAREAVPAAALHLASAESMPLADSSVDLVLCAVSMHHWSDSGAGLREVARVLRPGGRFCFADWVMTDWLTKLLCAGAKTPESLKERFIRTDLQVVTQRPMVSRSLYVTIGVRK